MAQKFKLDFSIPTSTGRMKFVQDLFSEIDPKSLTKTELETCTNYILYGKDPEKDNTSSVDRKEIQIPTKYNTYKKQEPISLEALMENPTFDESQLKKEKNIYKKVKPTIDKEKCKDIPGMKELWEEIEKLNRKVRLAEGKDTPNAGEEMPNWDAKTLYNMKHQLVALRKEQYLLKDAVFPEMPAIKNFGHYFTHPTEYEMNYPVFPCGTMREENDDEFKHPWKTNACFAAKDIENELQERIAAKKPYFSFLDSEHIYQLCLGYYEIKDQAEKNPDSPLNNLIWTLDYYVEKANLNPQQALILEGKKKRLLNREICERLMSELGIYHQENYISTIWNKITKLIADAADLSFDEWCCKNYEKAWKTCNCCGEKMLRDPRNFVRKSKAPDGLTNRCKRCDQKKRRGEI